MAKFRPRNDDELSRLDDEALLEYIAAARAQGDDEHTQKALAIIVFRYHDNITRRVAIKVPRDDIEDVAQEAVVSAVRSRLDGSSIGEFRKWLNQIVSRRIADYHRKRERQVEATELPEEHGDDDEIWGQVAKVEDETGAVEVRDAVETVYARLSPAHQRVIDLFVFAGHSAEGTKDEVNDEFPELDPPMSVDNVSQIAKRFRDAVRGILDGSDAEPEDETDEEDSSDESDNPD